MQNGTLDKIHKVEIELMDEFKRICEAHGLRYFLDSGTALGAVRHAGFIPWDDDIDLGMPRSDYEKFLLFASRELDPKYALQTHETDGNYYKFNAKIRKKNTFFEEKGSELYRERGISIDIFPFDYLPDGRIMQKISLSTARTKMRLIRFHMNGGGSKNPVKKLLHKIVARFDLEKMRKRYDSYCKRIDESSYMACYSYRMIQSKDILFKAADLLPVRDILFENALYSIMNDPDAYLKEMYGDYMQLPPEEKRQYHLEGKVLFGDEESF